MPSATHARYRQTEKGKAAMKRSRERYKKSENGKAKRSEWLAAYFKTEKGKETKKRQGAARTERKRTLREEKKPKPMPIVQEYTGIIIHRCV